jgi:2-oxoisovalerate dehydrogenase E1 component beta subunit
VTKASTTLQEVTYLEALTDALAIELARDESVVLMGEDIGAYGGAFKVTKGLMKRFGADRVMDTPLSESALFGVAIGAALMGLRPVVEVQYADFIHCGWDQLVNVAAKMHYRSEEAVPLVVRAPSGAELKAGPFHSQSPETYFAHTPGLKVVAPATPYDAKGLLIGAIRDNNPVIFFEHKFLYRRLKDKIPEGDYVVPIGKANVAREGTDVSVITYGAMLSKSIEAAEMAQKEGISVEVLDLRTISPLDKQAIFNTVKKNGKVIIVYEANYSFGVGAEVSALITERAYEFLEGPVIRIASADTPVPYSPLLEDAYLPQTENILEAIKKLVEVS